MPGAFAITIEEGGPPALEVQADALCRRDVDHHRGNGIEALVVGYPHREGPAWVTARDIAERYLSSGRLLPDDIHGFFTLVVLDDAAARVSIATDRFACYDVFAHRDGSRLVISDSVEEIARRAGRLTVDVEAVLRFLCFGHFVGSGTHFVEIEKLPGATVTEAGGNGPASSRYWRFGEDPPEEGSVGLAEVLGVFDGHIADCFALARGASVSLTGGLDSRSILAACLPYRGRLRGFSYGGRLNRDVRTAGRLCASAGVPHATYSLDGGATACLPENSKAAARRMNGMVNFILFSHLDAAYASEARYAEALFTGIGTDLFSLELGQSRRWLMALFTGIGTDLFRAYWIRGGRERPIPPPRVITTAVRRWCRSGIPGLLKSTSPREVMDRTREALESDVRENGAGAPGLYAEYACLRERNTNFATYIVSTAGEHMVTWDTFLFGPLQELAPGLTRESRIDRRVQRTLTQRAAPLARIATVKGQPAGLERLGVREGMRASAYVGGDYYRKSANWMGRRTMRREPARLTYTVDYTEALVSNRGFVEDLLDPGRMITADLFDCDALLRSRDLLLRGYGNLVYEMTNVMCLEMWLRHIAGLTSVRMPGG